MKLPNGYGSVVKLSGKRRKPYAVRISYMAEENGIPKRKRKYLEYFAKKEAALNYLAEYNNNNVVPEHQKYTDIPTFSELFEKWKKYKMSLKKAPGKDSWRNYGIAFERFSAIHDMKVINIKAQTLQEVLNANNSKSKSTISNMRTILRGMWSYAVMNEILENDITQNLVFDYTDPNTPSHTRFTDAEIERLWKELYVINNIDIILIYIYTGLRPTELLDIESENVHIKERYMIGGIKTDAGRNRIIPIHERIVPLIENRLAQNRKYLIVNKYGNHYTRNVYTGSNWNTCMNLLNMNHSPHDGRYTFASLADKYNLNETCLKIIMGHALSNKDKSAFKTGQTGNITKGIYTEKTLEELLSEINKIP